MRIKEEYKVREMAGEHIVVMQGRYGVDMTKVIALNETSLWLWNRLQGREFGTDDVRDLHLGENDEDAEPAVLGRWRGIRRIVVLLFGAGEWRGAYLMSVFRLPYRMRFAFGRF
mgnify:CR=1 FL=1